MDIFNNLRFEINIARYARILVNLACVCASRYEKIDSDSLYTATREYR